MNFSTNRDSVIRMVTTAIAVINAVLVMLGVDAISVADHTVYVIASGVALIVTVVIAVYKHNATSPLGCLIRKIYDLANKYGIEAIYEVIISALEEFLEDYEEEGEE